MTYRGVGSDRVDLWERELGLGAGAQDHVELAGRVLGPVGQLDHHADRTVSGVQPLPGPPAPDLKGES